MLPVGLYFEQSHLAVSLSLSLSFLTIQLYFGQLLGISSFTF
jgi:hypothetical protein